MSPLNQSLLSGIIGGVIGSVFTALFSGSHPSPITNVPAQGVQRSRVVAAEDFELVDKEGRLRAQLAMGREGGPALFIMDSKGVARVVLGVYPPGEGELPFLVLNDSDQNAAGLFRLVGSEQSPFVILKHKGADKSIFGLSQATGESAFLYHNNDGQHQVVFGKE